MYFKGLLRINLNQKKKIYESYTNPSSRAQKYYIFAAKQIEIIEQKRHKKKLPVEDNTVKIRAPCWRTFKTQDAAK